MRWLVLCLSLLLASSNVFAQADPGAQPDDEQPDAVTAPDQGDDAGLPEAAEEAESADEADPDGADHPEEAEEAESTDKPRPIQPPRAEQRPLSFFLLGSLRGYQADIDCRREEPVDERGLHYARQAAYFHQLTDAADQAAARPIALNVGNSAFPGALARYLLTSQEGAQDFAQTLAQIPYRAHAIGQGEIGMERRQLLHLLDGAQAADLPMDAANLVCTPEGGAEAICEAVGTDPAGTPWRVVERDGLDIGIITLLDPRVQREISPARAAGLDFLDPAERLPALLEQMHAQAKPDMTVVIYHLTNASGQAKAVDLASSVQGVDLVLTNLLLSDAPDAPEQSEQAEHGHIKAPSTGTYVVGANTGHKRAVTVDLNLQRADDDAPWQIAALTSSVRTTDGIEPHPETAGKLRDLAGYYCEDWGEAINPNLPLARPFDRSDLQAFILNVMRFATDSEVALVNRQTFADPNIFPIKDGLTLADIFTFVPYSNRLVTVTVKGSVLTRLAGQLGDNLVATGLTKDDDKVRVNGRPVRDDRLYRVATHQFLAAGGDQILSSDDSASTSTYQPEWIDEPPTIGVLVAEYVRTAAFEPGVRADALEPDESFPDLHRKFLWNYTGSINASFNRVAVNNPSIDGQPAYEQSQLTVNDTTQINLEGNGEIRADSRNHVWTNRLLTQYAQARVSDDEGTSFEETKDLIRYRSTYQYAGFRADAGGVWYVPLPFTELQVESEFTEPDERDWHKLELTGIGGAKFQLFDPLEIRIGVNARRDVTNPDGETTYGLNAGYLLNRTRLVDLLNKPIQFESELEYFYNDIGASNIQEIRNTNRIYFALLDQLFFTTTFQAFLYRTDDVGEFGSNTELTVGLNYLWDSTVQSF